MASTLDITQIRNDFPILHQNVRNKPLVYLDNAATTQKPLSVINALNNYYTHTNSNIHRGVHFLAEKATAEFEETRSEIQAFLNAESADEIVFTKGTTDGLNLIASSFGGKYLKAGDEVIITTMEHHSNIVPWQLICEKTGAKLKVIPINNKGELLIDAFEEMLSEKTKIVSVVYASNSLGTINPLQDIIRLSHEFGAKVVVDAAQAVAHIPIDVRKMNIDFLVFSAHKLYGPTGVGALYGKWHLLNDMPPYQGGGEMIKEVTFEKTTYNTPPFKFEAGTPNIGDIIAFREAIKYVNNLGLANIAAHEKMLHDYATEQLNELDWVQFVGTAKDKVSVVSFNLDGIHPFDAGMMLDSRGIAVRTGHLCTQPLMRFFNIEGTIRASFAVYNTKEEIDALIIGVKKVITIMG